MLSYRGEAREIHHDDLTGRGAALFIVQKNILYAVFVPDALLKKQEGQSYNDKNYMGYLSQRKPGTPPETP